MDIPICVICFKIRSNPKNGLEKDELKNIYYKDKPKIHKKNSTLEYPLVHTQFDNNLEIQTESIKKARLLNGQRI